MNENPAQPDAPQPYESNRYAALVLNLGRALLHVGSPAHRLEDAMQIMASRLGLQAEFFSTPTALIVSLGDGEKQRTFLARSDPGSTNLAKLADLTEVMEQLAAGHIDPEPADERVRQIDQAAPIYGYWLQLLGFVALSGGIAPLIGGGWREMLLALALGTVTGLIVLWLRRHVERSRLASPLTATVVTFLGVLWCSIDPQTALVPAVIASIIALVPGMDLTTASRELATGHLVSGSSRLAFALTIFALLALGLVMGGMTGTWLVGPVDLISASPAPAWLPAAGVMLAALGLMLLNQAHLRDWVWILLACLIAYAGARLGIGLEAPVIGAFIGALAVGLAGNLFVTLTGRPGSVMHLPGLILLVPGSIGLRGLATLLADDVISGIETAVMAGMIAVALTTGMILASVLLPPRTSL
ncbi:MAG: threonine/serine exporter family protein [Wenzhouxiangella sp.]|nr:MAG: threonine/serine exporter family protein [Wenzhouxiangella sp.]